MKRVKVYVGRMKPKTICPPRKPPGKIFWSWFGAFVGIYAVAISGQALVELQLTDQLFLIGSFGASAVLAYGAPLADFSQPRNLVLGHCVSAAIGVTVHKLHPSGEHLALATALAVSLAVVAMHVARALHPPGGATALIGVIGSENVHRLGYGFVLCPVLAGAAILLVVALVVNNLLRNPKRHYPTYWF